MPHDFNGRDLTPIHGRVGIVVSRYNDTITNRLLQGALATLTAAGVADDAVDVCWVPGAWELPVVAQEMARDGRYVALICLGAVIRGETTHDEHINRQVSLSLGQIALDASLPVAFGVLTCNSLEQALQRAGGSVGNKGHEATEAALEMIRLLARLRQSREASSSASGGASEGGVAKSYYSNRSEPETNPGVTRPPREPPEAPRAPRPLFPAVETPTTIAPAPPSEIGPRTTTPSEPARAGAEDSAPVTSGSKGPTTTAGSGKRGPRVRRRRGREVVLQMLYADDVHPHRNMADADEFLRRRLNFDPSLVKFASGLLAGVRKNRPEIDVLLSKQAANWSLQRMAVTDRNVLRLGAYEILFTETPRVVVINEAVDLARRYGSQQSASFVNGILDRLKVERRDAPAE